MKCSCGRPKSADIHSKWSQDPERHSFADPRRPGLAPVSEGMREFRRESGYGAAAAAAKGQPCEIKSPVCSGAAQSLHESLPRGRAGGLRASVESGARIWKACHPCNDYCSEHPRWAREHGYLVRLSDLRNDIEHDD